MHMCYGLKAAEFKLVLICDHCDVLTSFLTSNKFDRSEHFLPFFCLLVFLVNVFVCNRYI